MLSLVDSRLYLVVSEWVQFVNNLFIDSSLSSVLVSPVYKNSNISKNLNNVQVWFVQVFYTFLYSYVSTYKKYFYNLLNNVYTHNPQYLLLRLLKKI